MQILKKSYDVETILGLIERNEIKFDNPIQRGEVWNRNKRSYLIHSIIVGYPVNVVYSNKIGYINDILDGQQRLTTIQQYYNGDFKLSELPYIIIIDNRIEDLMVLCFDQLPKTLQKVIEDSSGCEITDEFKKKEFKQYPPELKEIIIKCEEVINISGKKFEDLPSVAKQCFLHYNIDLQYGENLRQGQVATLFDRLNGGKPLTATEKAKALIISPQIVQELCNHPIFTKILSKDAIKAKSATTYIMQSYVVLFCKESRCLLGKTIGDILNREEITEQQKELLKSCFNIYLEVIKIFEQNNQGVDKKLLRIFKAKSHFSSLLPVAEEVLKNKSINIPQFVDWLRYFFGTEAGITSISDEYNSKLKDAMNSSASVTTRINVAKKSFENYLENPPKKEVVEQISLQFSADSTK